MADSYQEDALADVESLLAWLRNNKHYPSWSQRVTHHAVRLEGTCPSTEIVIDVDHQRHGSLELRYPLWEQDETGATRRAFEMRTVELDMKELP